MSTSDRHKNEIVVKISGLDPRKQRFWQTTGLSRATRNNIRIHAIPGCCCLGDVVTVSFDKKAADYRVTSIDDEDYVELTAVNNDECIFPRHLLTASLEREKDHTIVALPGASAATLPFKSSSPPEEKRRFARVALRTDVRVNSRSTPSSSYGTTADVSPGGCYVELASPMPVGTEVEIFAGSDTLPFRALGRVVTSHPMFGMGVAFDDEQPEIQQLLSHREPKKDTEMSAKAASQQTTETAESIRAEKLFSDLLIWFASNSNLERSKFFELLHNCSRIK
jgi:hypothetical protein